jgi:hypothetical protein
LSDGHHPSTPLQVQSLFSNSSESFALPQLGANSSLHFIGPLRGVLPSGPNGLPGLNPLQSSPLSDAQAKAVMLSYNYTLDHQGIAINVSCVNFDDSPIKSMGVSDSDPLLPLITYGSSCDELGLFDVSMPGTAIVVNGANLLKFAACKSAPLSNEDPTYYIFLSGSLSSTVGVGNITCTVPPIQPATFPVMYQSNKGVFSITEPIETSGPTTMLTTFIESAIILLGLIVVEVQTLQSNLLADLVMNIGAQSLGSPQENSTQEYLPLYAAMIEGILINQVRSASNSSLPLLMVVPQVTYNRFIYSVNTNPGPPSSCLRQVNGTLSEEVMGWVAKPVHIAFLLPVTIINLASLFVILIAKVKEKRRGRYEFDPSDPRPLVLAEHLLAEGDPSGWTDGVSYRPREVCECRTIPVLINNNWWLQWLREKV